MPTLRFRLPGRAQPLRAWLAWLLPELDREARGRLIDEGRVRVDGRLFDRSAGDCPAGARVEIDDVPDSIVPPRPVGAHPAWSALIDEPAWRGGALHVSEEVSLEFKIDERRAGLARIVLEGPACEAPAICAALAREGMPIAGDLEHGGLALGGGVRLVGGDRATAFDEGSRDSLLDWPEEPAWVGEAHEQAHGAAESPELVFAVSTETARAIRKGHPWILADTASDTADRHRPGRLVRVDERGGGRLGWAHIEGEDRLAARLWARGDLPPTRIASVESRVARALARRRTLFEASFDSTAPDATNAFRLIHGEGDALPGIVVDRLGSLLRVLISGRASDAIRETVLDALRTQLPLTPEGESWSVLELLHLRAGGASAFDRVRWIAGGSEALVSEAPHGVGPVVPDGAEATSTGADFQVVERGLRFRVDPGWDMPRQVRPGFGLFLDQRENRERLAVHAARGGRWLNLFAHTGAFSASLLAAGAEHVTSVDLSAAYLKRLEANLLANVDRGVDPARHLSQRSDGRRFLETLPAGSGFAGIVLDPPTAAAAGHRFWSLSRDLEPLVRRCVALLEPGGVLLVTQNRSGAPLGLDRSLERAAARQRRPVRFLDPAPAGPDHPALDGFPEGDPFEGWMLGLD